MVLKLTRIADYGVLLMAKVAASEKPCVAAVELSGMTHIPAPTVSKILQTLLAGGVLSSVRGAKGGYSLVGAASDISVADILLCFDHELALTACNTDALNCEQQDNCTISHNWQGINRSIVRVLHHISLSDMMADDFSAEFCLASKPQFSPPLAVVAEPPCHACTGV
ncbi:MAG: SUF system Fe-S cluster assembly regulator [Mariprofundaceae bacterium]|nr:SUF system Fe-S cluster assembly regulator [Mariprofundaceae bacterium]